MTIQYAPILFSQAGLSSDNASFLASGVSSILMFAVSIPGFMLADKWGRRTSAITGGVMLSGCMLLIGSLYAAGAVHPYGFARWVVIVSVFAVSTEKNKLISFLFRSVIEPSTKIW